MSENKIETFWIRPGLKNTNYDNLIKVKIFKFRVAIERYPDNCQSSLISGIIRGAGGAGFFCALPRPAPFDFELQGHAEESSDQDDQPKDHYVLQRRSYNDRPNDVACDEEFQTEKDGPSQVLPVKSVGFTGCPVSLNNEATSGEDGASDNHKYPYSINCPTNTVHHFTIVSHHTLHSILTGLIAAT